MLVVLSFHYLISYLIPACDDSQTQNSMTVTNKAPVSMAQSKEFDPLSRQRSADGDMQNKVISSFGLQNDGKVTVHFTMKKGITLNTCT